jgi:DNA (cytosine-5)-methyltransferase 1
MKILKPGENLNNLSTDEINTREHTLGLTHRAKPKSLQGYVRMAENKVANTMMFGNTCLPIHPTEHRSISVREAATFQSFPLTFEFLGGIAAQYKQVGNAVPWKIGHMLANLISSQ